MICLALREAARNEQIAEEETKRVVQSFKVFRDNYLGKTEGDGPPIPAIPEGFINPSLSWVAFENARNRVQGIEKFQDEADGDPRKSVEGFTVTGEGNIHKFLDGLQQALRVGNQAFDASSPRSAWLRSFLPPGVASRILPLLEPRYRDFTFMSQLRKLEKASGQSNKVMLSRNFTLLPKVVQRQFSNAGGGLAEDMAAQAQGERTPPDPGVRPPLWIGVDLMTDQTNNVPELHVLFRVAQYPPYSERPAPPPGGPRGGKKIPLFPPVFLPAPATAPVPAGG